MRRWLYIAALSSEQALHIRDRFYAELTPTSHAPSYHSRTAPRDVRYVLLDAPSHTRSIRSFA